MIDPIHFVVFSSLLFMIGAYGVIRNKNSIVVLMSVEIMLTAANINFVAFSSFYHDLTGQVMALFVTTIAAAEVAMCSPIESEFFFLYRLPLTHTYLLETRIFTALYKKSAVATLKYFVK